MFQFSDDDPAEPPVVPGETVGSRYVIDRLLGAGGMGVVYSAFQTESDLPVAIKFLKPELGQHPRCVQRFVDEARAAAELQSAHVVKILDMGELRSQLPYIVMEFLEGMDLDAVLARDGTLGVERAVDYVLQACRGLSEAHGAGIVHRDIKPENLFLATTPNQRPVVKIIDFGVAKRLRASSPRIETGKDESVGSPGYMSPEQIGAERIDARTDVWAIGVVLYRLLSGELPFDGNSLMEIYGRILGTEPAPLGGRVWGIDPYLEAIVRACLQKDRDARYSSVDAVILDLERWSEARHAACVELASREFPTTRGGAPEFAGADTVPWFHGKTWWTSAAATAVVFGTLGFATGQGPRASQLEVVALCSRVASLVVSEVRSIASVGQH